MKGNKKFWEEPIAYFPLIGLEKDATNFFPE
jgi:hypothetical protein